MKKIKIGIVEDEMIIASVIHDCLQKLNYQVLEPVMSYKEAIEMLYTEQPDLLVIDIRISGKLDGIHLAEYIRENYSMPFIFVTANSDSETLSRAKKTNPNAYLLKPFTHNDLYAAIEIGLNNFEMQKTVNTQTSIVVKDGYAFFQVPLSEILYLISADNYVQLFLVSGKSVLTRSSLNEIKKRLPHHLFFQISRSCIVNISFISKVDKSSVMIKEVSLPISNPFRELIIDQLNRF